MNKAFKNKRKKLMVVAAATAGMVALLWFAMIHPLRAKLASLRTQAGAAQALVEQGRRTIAAGAQVTNELGAVLGQLRAAERDMASGDLYDWMIQTMNRFKAGRAIDIPQISRESVGTVGMFPNFPYRAASFALSGTAFYHDLGKFLADLENTFPYMQVQNLQLGPAATLKQEGDEHLHFTLQVLALIKPVNP